MAWWAWAILGFLLLAAELATPGGFYFLFFGVGALLVGAVALLGPEMPAWVEWLAFTASSLVLLATLRRPLLQRFASKDSEDVDQIVGQQAQAVEEIPSGSVGRVELRGSAWQARNAGNRTLLPGDRCLVESMNGFELTVRAKAAAGAAAAAPAAKE